MDRTGRQNSLLLPIEKESFLHTDLTHVGVIDFYERSHWAPRSDVIEAKRIWKEAFQNEAV